MVRRSTKTVDLLINPTAESFLILFFSRTRSGPAKFFGRSLKISVQFPTSRKNQSNLLSGAGTQICPTTRALPGRFGSVLDFFPHLSSNSGKLAPLTFSPPKILYRVSV